ncbi:MAG TPA: polyphosphate:AMP phosphotransferase [Polyangia bacterium]|jgi:polyphosphate:AMP phosphotransferase|nr:polyphosphate:AMP phosphotransferase [Polyangia bacterium]
MFESSELGHKIDKATYEAELPALRESLLDAQLDLLEAKKFPVLLLIGGVDGAGKGETVNLLTEWMDPRHIRTHAVREPTDEERERPRMWRFWRDLPPKGKIGIFFGSWYTDPIVGRVTGDLKTSTLDQRLEEINRFERMLTDEGALILKLWFHLSKERQKKRLKALAADPLTRWRVTDTDWEHFKLYDRFRKVSEHALRTTSTAEAPWTVIEGADARYRSLTAGKLLLEALRRRLDEAPPPRSHSTAPLAETLDNRSVLRALDLTKALPKEVYQEELELYQGRLNLLTRHPRFQKKSAIVLVFEGNDAAGKGGAIRRVTGAIDARQYVIVPVAAPTEEERAQPYLWRFWRHLPRRGRVAIFDRSWYGRVLVERVEGFCSVLDWMRAYSEINDFEEQLVKKNVVVVKFWLSITQDEQLRRFEERQQTGYKRFKITEEDWRNRDKWDVYEQAVCDMVDRTSTEIAPWTLVEANDKMYARIKVMRTLCERLEAAL